MLMWWLVVEVAVVLSVPRMRKRPSRVFSHKREFSCQKATSLFAKPAQNGFLLPFGQKM